MNSKFFHVLLNTGVKIHHENSDRRAIVLSNVVALTFGLALFVLFLAIPANISLVGFFETLFEASFFLVAILFNRLGFTKAARLYLSWAPPILLTWFTIMSIGESDQVPASMYMGFRFYLLSFCCIPYLIMDRDKPIQFIAAILPGLIITLFYDQVLELFQAAPSQKGYALDGYSLTSTRTFVSYLIINSICFSLKWIIDTSDRLNVALIGELETKNRIIQQQAEEKIRESEHNYQALFDQSSDAIILTDAMGNFQAINSATLELLGYTREELLQMNIQDVIDPQQLLRDPIPFKELVAGASILRERQLVNRSGKMITVEIRSKKIGVNQLLGTARDITERKHTAQKLLKYIRELALFNAVNEAIAKSQDIDALLKEFCQILVKEGDYKLVWIGQHDAESNTIKALVGEGSAKAYLNTIQIDLNNPLRVKEPEAQALLQRKTQIVNEIFPSQEHEVWVENRSKYELYSSMSIQINAAPVACFVLNLYTSLPNSFDSNEASIIERLVLNIANAIKSLEATRERDLAKRELENAYERLNFHITNTPLGVIERNQKLEITFWNKRAEEIFGWTAEEVLGKQTHEFLSHPDNHEASRSLIEAVHREKLKSAVQERKHVTKDGRIIYGLWYYSIVWDRADTVQTILSFVSDITEQREVTFQLNERIKELTAFYKISRLLNNDHREMSAILTEVADAIIDGFQYPSICEVRISFLNYFYQTPNFQHTTISLKENFVLNGVSIGALEAAYSIDNINGVAVTFFNEERNLIRMIVEMLQIYFVKKREEESLLQAQANLEATINNTEIMIWSVDRNFNLVTFNKPFSDFNYKAGIVTSPGINHRNLFSAERTKLWDERYNRCLMGESYIVEDRLGDMDVRFSLNPIIEGKQITGVSVFCENVSERNLQERALAEANKMISDLRVMALRSVMNPHFIFNVLNSIQFFIANNDRLNAINYLSTFSKLIRMVLTHSIADTISLYDELELLKNYIELEQVRFEDKFDFVIEVEENIETKEVQIPSLLVQPYIENSILHGLYNKEGKGFLKIHISKNDDFLIFVIEDDGVGREAAQKLKNEHHRKHQSVGTKLTEERLKWINDGTKISVVYEDLMNKELPLGTRVTMKIKLEE